MKSRVLTLDIETMADLVWSWGTWSKNWRAIDTEQEWYPLSFGAKWGDEETMYYGLEDYKGYKPTIKRHRNGSVTFRRPNIRPLMQDAWDLLQEADVLVGWNSKRFDIKKLNSCFIALGFPPYKLPFHVDVMKEKTKLTNSNANSLAYTSIEWKLGNKLSNDGFPLWLKCCEGDTQALADMKEYCIRDVDQTEKLYLHLRPWIQNHPPMNVLEDNFDGCSKCGENEGFIPNYKYRHSKTGNMYQYVRCKACKASVRKRVPEDSYKKVEFVS